MIWMILIGFFSGIISGMGIGGGTILIPALVIFFQTGQKTAQNMNLIYFIPTAAAALVSHVKQKNIEKKGTLKIILFGLAGAAGGSFLAMQMDPEWLRKGFGGFLLVMGIIEFFKKS